MRTLYHFSLSPFSRKVRVFLKEKSVDFTLQTENFWERRREFLAMNPSSQVPVILEEDGTVLSDSTAICEYMEECYPEPNLIGKDTKERFEIRRISNWFNNKFYYEVTKHIIDEKVYKYYRMKGEPDSDAIRAGKTNVIYHLEYIDFLLQKRIWLAGDRFSLADITAASHLSCLDYMGDVPWEDHTKVKEWYALVKSRPSFRPILNDRVPGFKPPNYYADPDF